MTSTTIEDDIPDELEAQPEDDLTPPADQDVPAEAEVEVPDLDDRVSAVAEAKPLALNWINSAVRALGDARRGLEANAQRDPFGEMVLQMIRRHFHTDRRSGATSEAAAVGLIERNFLSFSQFLKASDGIFAYVDDATAAKNTRGYFGSEITVSAYAYPMESISFTRDYTGLGVKCRAAVLIHQLAFFTDARVRDHGSGGLSYDSLNFETALFNAHSYPNFAVNASPPYSDERFGMLRPDE